MHRSPAAMVTKPVDVDVTINTPRDPNTLSNYHNFVTRHTTAEFEIDFEKKVLKGGVGLRLESLTNEPMRDVILDTRYVWWHES
jgi:leukotriene-A4 hydrolase